MNDIVYFIKKYLENRPMMFAFIRPTEAVLFNKNLKYIKSPVLDFGCGDGFFAKVAFGNLHGITRKRDQQNNTENNAEFIGIDLNTNQRVKEARKNEFYKKIVLYDGKKIPLPDNHFQTIISNCVLEHLPYLETSLNEIYRVLAPGGYFLTTVMIDNWEKYLLGGKIFGNWYKKFMRKKQEHHNLLTMEQWNNEFMKLGFNIIKTKGYVTSKQVALIDLFHYLSISSLITYKLFKKWVIFPKLFSNTSMNRFIEVNINKHVGKKESAGLFYILKK